MDTVTHALLGALIARVKREPRTPKAESASVVRTVSITIAAGFPDIDYLLFWWNSYQFITYWHRGITHSLVMVPLWSIGLGLLFSLLARRVDQWGRFSRWCALGLICHIAADIVTVYGTQVFAPFTDRRVALYLTFDFDPWVGLMTGVCLIASYFYRGFARWGMVMLLIYLTTQFFLQRSAVSVAKQAENEEAGSGFEVYAFPQPYTPLYWKLVVKDDELYRVAYLDLLRKDHSRAVEKRNSLSSLFAAYQSKNRLVWRRFLRFGEGSDRKIALEVWGHPLFGGFRRFAEFPLLLRVDWDRPGVCVWFTDLRHILPGLLPPFRYGMCRSDQKSEWSLYRLKRFTEDERQWIPVPSNIVPLLPSGLLNRKQSRFSAAGQPNWPYFPIVLVK